MSFRVPSGAARGRTAPAAVAARSRSASPRRGSPGGSPRGVAGGNWVISPASGRPIKVLGSKGERGDALDKLIRSGVASEAWLADATRYGDDPSNPGQPSPAARAAGKLYRDRSGLTGQTRENKVYYNSATGRTSKKDPSRAQTGGASTLIGPFDTEAQALDEAQRRGLRKTGAVTVRLTKAGVPYKKPAQYDTFVRGGAVLKTGERAYIPVGGPAYNAAFTNGTLVDGNTVDQLPRFTKAQKKAAAVAKSSARRPAGRVQSPREKRDNLAAVRAAQANRQFVFCVVNPNSGTTVGVEDTQGRTTGSARKIAKEQGLDGATNSEKVSDARVISHLRDLVNRGTLQKGRATKKCPGN